LPRASRNAVVDAALDAAAVGNTKMRRREGGKVRLGQSSDGEDAGRSRHRMERCVPSVGESEEDGGGDRRAPRVGLA
jgi:hypothetical protein